MRFLETRSEVKFKITVTQLLYATLRQSKMHPHTKFEIPTSNIIRFCCGHDYSGNKVRGQGHSDPKMVHDTPLSQDASTRQIWKSSLKEYKRYARDTIILKTRPEVKVTLT